MELTAELGGCIPGGHSRQVDPYFHADALLRRGYALGEVLDLGCGAGDSVDHFRKTHPEVHWIGLDIEHSPEVASRTRTDAEFRTFDGVHLPFGNARFDLVFTRQALEHVREPRALLAEVCRVLKPGGFFTGSTSHVELYHSYSYWSFTPFGFRALLEDAGLRLVEIRPGIDAVTLILRRVLDRPRFFERWFHRESPLNRAIGAYGTWKGKDHRWVNTAKLLCCGHFVFLADRPTSAIDRAHDGGGPKPSTHPKNDLVSYR